jgi:hypothetical protein
MDSAATRPLRLGCFDVRNGTVFAADESLPVAAEFDAATGETVRVFSWPLSRDHRGRPVALDILGRDDSVLIASPAAGGIVEIDRRSGQATTIPLDADAGTLLASGDAIWAVGRPDWDGPPARRPAGKRPVIWEEPTDEEIARHRQMMRHLPFPGAGQLDEEPGGRSLAGWRDAEGDFEDLELPTPIWRVVGGVARRIDADLEQPVLAAADGKLAGVCRLPSDPIIKHLSPGGGSVSWRYPGTAVVIDDPGTLDVLGPVPGSGGAAWADGGTVWLLGFEREADDEPAPEVRELLIAEHRVGEALGVRPQRPVAVAGRFVVDLAEPDLAEPDAAEPDAADDPAADPAHESAVIRFLPVDGGPPWTAGPADLGHSVLARAWGGEVWLADPGTSTLAAAAPGRPGLRKLRISLDCRPWMPRPQLPAGLDAQQFEHDQLDRLQGAFLGGWGTPEGDPTPFIEGVIFDVIEVRGEFPDRVIVALFHAVDRPGIQFGRQWRLYDELGNPVDHEYADIGLMEDVESADGGLPPAGHSIPDQAGVVWF